MVTKGSTAMIELQNYCVKMWHAESHMTLFTETVRLPLLHSRLDILS